MAKSQKRSSREQKKPKQDKQKTAVLATPFVAPQGKSAIFAAAKKK